MTTLSVGNITKDAFTPLIDKSSSAACADEILTLGNSLSVKAIAQPLNISACETISYFALYVSIESENIRFTSTVSAPQLLRYAAASKVRTPVFNTKFLVSSIIPAIRACASG